MTITKKTLDISALASCMDEINIASLSDLLRVELRDRQVIMSTHEQDIANFLIYRYSKAGLSHKKINLLNKHRVQPNEEGV